MIKKYLLMGLENGYRVIFQHYLPLPCPFDGAFKNQVKPSRWETT
jgi:hypothetical protein